MSILTTYLSWSATDSYMPITGSFFEILRQEHIKKLQPCYESINVNHSRQTDDS